MKRKVILTICLLVAVMTAWAQKVNVTGQVTDEQGEPLIVTGYGAVARKNLTTSIVKVKGDDVIKTGTTNMSQMLIGRAAGLQAKNSGHTLDQYFTRDNYDGPQK